MCKNNNGLQNGIIFGIIIQKGNLALIFAFSTIEDDKKP